MSGLNGTWLNGVQRDRGGRAAEVWAKKHNAQPTLDRHALRIHSFFMIRHTVAFRLNHVLGSSAERDFLKAACELARIEGVRKFECLRQTSLKNNFSFGLSMEFADEAAYAFYSEHPEHVGFVQERWIPEVAEFMELDYVAYEP